MELAEREWSNAEEIKQVKQQHAKNLHKMREGCVRRSHARLARGSLAAVYAARARARAPPSPLPLLL